MIICLTSGLAPETKLKEDSIVKYCPRCGSTIADEATFCPACGNSIGAPAGPTPGYNPNPGYPPAPVYPAYDPCDHTAEFDPKDISDNKVISMLVYLTGWVGIFVALLASSSSKYASFHVRQALKFTVIETLIPIVLLVGAVINIIPVLGTIVYVLLALASVVASGTIFVLKIICFFQICKGKAKEPAIVNKLKFLK